LKLSQFQELLNAEFGVQFAQVLLKDVSLTDHQDHTPHELIKLGVDPKDIWLSICKQQSVPKERWNGIPLKKRHAE
jgi:hypothetical protein